jgi:hypothetical protein
MKWLDGITKGRQRMNAVQNSVPVVDKRRAVQVVLILLSVTAGSVDAIGFLGLSETE